MYRHGTLSADIGVTWLAQAGHYSKLLLFMLYVAK